MPTIFHRKGGFNRRSKIGIVHARLTRIVRDHAAFWHEAGIGQPQNKTRVWLGIENKAIIGIPTGTKVTITFGPASAIIMPDCVIRDSETNSTKVQNEGKNRDAETTEGFLTD